MPTPPRDSAPPDPVMDDPMLRVLRERHPEVDIVVLPQPSPPAAPEVDPDRLEALAADVDRSLAELLDRVVPDPDPDLRASGTTVGARWHEDEWGLTWYEATAVVGPLTRGDNVALLRATGATLVDLGWRARPVPGDRPRLEGQRRGGLEAHATVRPESLVVTLRTLRVRRVQAAAS